MEVTLPQLLKTVSEQGASDLHISINSAPRLRISGELVSLNLPPFSATDCKNTIYGILTDQQKRVFEQKKELDFAFSLQNVGRFRGNVFMQKGALAGVFRLIPFNIFTLDELGMPPILKRLCDMANGLILVTGPTGSGKSTTLASMIDYINMTQAGHIVTIEDPIEYLHSHKKSLINQREIGGDTNSFATALRSVLRQDPDVVLVGEMRDLETISLAITTAETGHLVFGTLHTNTAITSLNRMIDVFPPHQQDQVRSQLSLSLQAVISQQLIPSLKGGRVMCMELMIPNAAIRNLIRENKLHQIYSAMQTGQASSGMQTMNQSLLNMVQRRLIETQVALNISSNPEELQEMIYNFQAAQGKKPPMKAR